MVDTTSLQYDEIPMDFYVIGYKRQWFFTKDELWN
jgi:hypothetical protein